MGETTSTGEKSESSVPWDQLFGAAGASGGAMKQEKLAIFSNSLT